MNRLTRRILDAMLVDVLRRPCPQRVPRSGAAGAAVNCFSVMVNDAAGEPYLHLRSTDGLVAHALRWDGNSFTIDATIEHGAIHPSALEVTHFSGLDEVRFEGLTHLAIGRITRWPYLWLGLHRVWNAIAQRVFNMRSLGSQLRIDVLRDLLQCTMNNEDGTGTGAMQIMSHRHGNRWAGNPGWQEHHRRLDVLLRMLADSGEIDRHAHNYLANGRTVAIIEEAEAEDRRHRANVRLQGLLLALTLVTAVFTAAQANLFKLPMLADWSTKAPTSTATLRGPGTCLQLTPELKS